MVSEFMQHYANQIQNFQDVILLVNVILHLIFAGGVARDSGHLYKIGQRPAMVSGATWAFATLLGGVLTAALYWFIHHSTFTRHSRPQVNS